jgi:hypothetical protein
MEAFKIIYILIEMEQRMKTDAFCIFLHYFLGFNSWLESIAAL